MKTWSTLRCLSNNLRAINRATCFELNSGFRRSYRELEVQQARRSKASILQKARQPQPVSSFIQGHVQERFRAKVP
eukprot:CFRG0783T1